MIEIRNFTRKFKKLVAVEDLSLTIGANRICGFIGPNGAGKSTTIRFLATLSEADSGDAWIDGHSVLKSPRMVRRVMGYMPEEFGVYEGMRVWEYIDFFGAAYGIRSAERKRIVGEVLELVDLSHKKDDYVQGLSRGMKQRLCLAKSLVHNPKVLILDEPASGLDPRARVEMKALLRELRSMGKTILISSHILSELGDLCDSIAIIERGKLLAHGDLNEIGGRMRESRVIEYRLSAATEKMDQALGGHPGVAGFQQTESLYTVSFSGTNEALADLNQKIILAGVGVLGIREKEADLEEMFMKITTGAVN